MPGFDALGLVAFTTARAAGSFGLADRSEPVGEVMARWEALAEAAARLGAPQLATARQVHGPEFVEHRPGWTGWLRVGGVDGHLARHRGIALAVGIADCVPVFLAHPAGAIGVLHAGWRGTAAGILPRAIAHLAAAGFDPAALRCHLGPSIGGAAYEVGPEVHEAVTGVRTDGPTCLDLRGVLAEQAAVGGVGTVTVSRACTVSDRPRWFSHRGGDHGRQLAVLIAPSP